MSKHTNHKQSSIDAQSAAIQVNALVDELGLADALEKGERTTLRTLNARVPNALVEMVADLAAQYGGVLAGIAFDAAEARAVVEKSKTANALANAGRRLVRRAMDDDYRRRVVVADRTLRLYQALGTLVRMPEGKHLLPAFEQMHALVQGPVRRRRAKSAKASKKASTATPAPAAPAENPPPAVDATGNGSA